MRLKARVQKKTRRDGIKSCETCDNITFKTIIKGQKWVCRKCGHIREVKENG